jgi:hypothetical protein
VQNLDSLLGRLLPGSVKNMIKEMVEAGASGANMGTAKLVSTMTLSKTIDLLKDDKYDVYTKGYPPPRSELLRENQEFVQAPERFDSMRSASSAGTMQFYDATSQNGGSFMSAFLDVCAPTLYCSR